MDVAGALLSHVSLHFAEPTVHTTQALARRKVLSAPLVVAPALEDLGSDDPPDGPSLLGWVDVADVLRGLLTRTCARAYAQ